jgi:hypothetical protein
MQNSGLNFAKLLAKDENESEMEDPTPQIRVRRRRKSGTSNTVSHNNWMYIIFCSISYLWQNRSLKVEVQGPDFMAHPLYSYIHMTIKKNIQFVTNLASLTLPYILCLKL